MLEAECYPLSHSFISMLTIKLANIFTEYTLNKYVDLEELRPRTWQKKLGKHMSLNTASYQRPCHIHTDSLNRLGRRQEGQTSIRSN